MKTVALLRSKQNDKQCLGALKYHEFFLKSNFECVSLELFYANNAPEISSILIGSYICKYTKSNRLSKAAGKDVFTYELQNVPNRKGIRIHTGNFYTDIKGCILLGDGFAKINKDEYFDVTNSKKTILAFEKFMNKEDFILQIKNNF